MEMNKQLKWQTNIHTIELKMLLNAISKDFESFKAEIEKDEINLKLKLKLIMFSLYPPLSV